MQRPGQPVLLVVSWCFPLTAPAVWYGVRLSFKVPCENIHSRVHHGEALRGELQGTERGGSYSRLLSSGLLGFAGFYFPDRGLNPLQ